VKVMMVFLSASISARPGASRDLTEGVGFRPRLAPG
jgi:hypothetical protein